MFEKIWHRIRRLYGDSAEQKAVLTSDPPTPQGGLLISEMRDSILKAVQPQYLYKPPFGYPRPTNVVALRELAKNPYVFSVLKTLIDEAATTKWNIQDKEDNDKMGITPNEDVRNKITEFLKNPNINHESFSYILKQVITDILEVDAGVIVKVFNSLGELTQLYARDGASFLRNTDIYGTYTDREPFVEPLPGVFRAGNKTYFDNPNNSVTNEHLAQRYSIMYASRAAYFQYGQAFAAWPIPFGTREVVYMQANPRADSIYGRSPLEVLADIILTLSYGSKYNLDFYLNNNMPEGVISLEGAKQDDMAAFSDRLTATVRDVADALGFRRRLGFRIPVVNTPISMERFQLAPAEMQVIEQQKWFDRMMLRCFSLTENEMGTTDDSNKAVAQTQSTVFKRKALKPILSMIEYHVTTQIITEFENSEGLEFKFDDYDLDEDIKKHSLYESEIRMGIKTSEMVAAEEGIDVEELKKQKQEALDQQKDMMSFEAETSNNFNKQDSKSDQKNAKSKQNMKPKPKTSESEKRAGIEKKSEELDEIKEYVREIGKSIEKAFDEQFVEGE